MVGRLENECGEAGDKPEANAIEHTKTIYSKRDVIPNRGAKDRFKFGKKYNIFLGFLWELCNS